MKLSSNASHVVVVIFGLIISLCVYSYFSGYGEYKFLFWEINKEALAKTLAFISFGLYGRWCYEAPILPNEQGIQLFLGSQTGEVWNESNFLFIPRPLWSIWKKMSIKHFSFDVAAQNRTKEGHLMIVFATGRAIPENVQLLAKMDQEGIQQQVLGLSMFTLSQYIHINDRDSLLACPTQNVSEDVEYIFGKNEFYGLRVKVFTTKVIEVNERTRNQFDMLARAGDMQKLLASIKTSLPGLSEIECYSVYASMIGVDPAVMSHVVHGNGKSNVLLGNFNDRDDND